jgi:hypothetical protein
MGRFEIKTNIVMLTRHEYFVNNWVAVICLCIIWYTYFFEVKHVVFSDIIAKILPGVY